MNACMWSLGVYDAPSSQTACYERPDVKLTLMSHTVSLSISYRTNMELTLYLQVALIISRMHA